MEHWTLDLRIPLALVATMAAQTVLIVAIGTWWASEFNSRMNIAEIALVGIDNRVDAGRNERTVLAMSTARFEEKFAAMNASLKRVEDMLMRMEKDRKTP